MNNGSVDASVSAGVSGGVLDVHTHFFPTGTSNFAATTGDSRWPSLRVLPEGGGRIMRGAEIFRPVSDTCFDLEARLIGMDAAGIDEHVLSPVPVTLNAWAEPQLAAKYAREQNEAIADAIRSCTKPSRFQWMGSVPMQSASLAIAELEYAVRSLGMVGVEIGSEIDGRELDDPSLQDFWRAVVEMNVPVFVHPTSGPNVIRRGGVPYEFAIGMTTDTAMAATALVFGGVLEKNPGLRVGLAHGCGTFPWAYPRIARGSTLGAKGTRAEDALRHSDELVKTLWADTLVFDPLHLSVLKARFGAGHLMLGSDFPFYPDDWGHCCAVIDGAVADGTCTHHEAVGMRGANARRFLSGLVVE
jgi:aminocarboxymuconate-semialdehyde decarboxylase